MAATERVDTRTFDEDGFRRRAACVCVKDEKENEVLLISSRKFPERWIVPGGCIEVNEEPSVAAARETVEEAGVKGQLGRFLGTFDNPERKHRTQVFVLVVTEELDEWDDSISIGRKRKWFSIDEAHDLLSIHKPIECSFLKQLKRNDKVS